MLNFKTIYENKIIYILKFINFLFFLITFINYNFSVSISWFQIIMILVTLLSYIYIICVFKNIDSKNITYSVPIITVILFFSVKLFLSTTILSFFLFYELILLPSVILVYLSSPNKRSIHVSMYFFLWTQFGSFLVLLGIVFLSKQNKLSDIIVINNVSTDFFSASLLILGFGIKIPIWPFHFWLTKTHVEANTAFSIFLSGILIKTALFGLYKLKIYWIDYYYVLLFLILVGSIDVSVKIKFQKDFKKLVAYLTVQEMSVMLIIIIFNSISSINIVLYFIILHTICSSIFFFFSEVFYKRIGSRQINLYSSLLTKTFILSIIFYFNAILFVGIPFTLKFFIEIGILYCINNFTISLLVIVIIFIQYISIIYFFKHILTFLFGYSTKLINDLTKIELFILLLPTVILLLLGLIICLISLTYIFF